MSATDEPTTRARAAAYPLPRPAGGGDTRFSIGLALDVAAVLARHGYPPITTGADLLHLQQALHTTIYTPPTKETPLP